MLCLITDVEKEEEKKQEREREEKNKKKGGKSKRRKRKRKQENINLKYYLPAGLKQSKSFVVQRFFGDLTSQNSHRTDLFIYCVSNALDLQAEVKTKLCLSPSLHVRI